MLHFLKDHPFIVNAFFESSVVLTYAVPKEEIAGLLPECLVPDTFNDKWAFIAVAMVQTKHLRPGGFPAFMGNNFFLIGYRVFVRYTTNAGKRLRGLYILGSETDKRKMVLLGNLFTHYNYRLTDIQQNTEGTKSRIFSRRSDLNVEIDTESECVPLPAGSPFSEWKEARRFAGPLPFTFSYNKATRTVLMIQGRREDWEPQPVKVINSRVGFIEQLGYKNISLASAFIVRNIPYHWQKGVTEIWQGQ